jgi:4-hydroxybenzoate polyprenyltransferase
LIGALLRASRPHQWVKNVAIFGALVFARKLADIDAVTTSLLAFAAFSLAASGNYLVNDVLDRERDRLHPRKRERPVASGELPATLALVVALALEAAGLAAAFLIRLEVGVLLAGYLALMTAYSLRLKRVVILDVMIIASGFVIRVVLGGAAIEVPISEWLVLCTIFLSLFLGFGKRRAEIELLEDRSTEHREALASYSCAFLDQLIVVCTSCVLATYALYTLSPVTIAKFGTRDLVFTVPFVIFGIFRYLYLLHRRGLGDSPTRALLHDRPTLLAVVLWAAVALVVIYR